MPAFPFWGQDLGYGFSILIFGFSILNPQGNNFSRWIENLSGGKSLYGDLVIYQISTLKLG